MKLTKKLCSMMLCISLVFTLTACGNSKTDETDTTVKIGVLRIDDSLPFYIAEQEGLYEKHGVNVEIIQFGSAKDKDTALEAGEIDGDMTDLIVTALLDNSGTDVKITNIALGATAEEGRFMLLSSPNSGITDLEGLKGQSISVGNNTIVHFLAEEVARLAGFAEDEIKTENIPDLSLRLETLLEGADVKATVLPDPLASLAVLNGANVIIDDTKLDYNMTQSVVIFRTDSLEEKATEIGLAMDAYYEAMELLNENPEQYRDHLLEFSRVPEALKADYPFPSYTPGVLPSEENVANVSDWMERKGLIENPLHYDELICKDYLK